MNYAMMADTGLLFQHPISQAYSIDWSAVITQYIL